MYTTKQVIIMRTDLNMRKGKMAAQAAHASLAVFLSLQERENEKQRIFRKIPVMDEWLANSYAKICVGVDSEEGLLQIYEQAKEAGIICSLIQDNGTTEFHGVPTYTCIGIGPDYSDKIDKITKELKLL